jgi:hypothetical protein
VAEPTVVLLCPHPQMRGALERALGAAGGAVRIALDVPAFRALVSTVTPEIVVIVALARDELIAVALDEIGQGVLGATPRVALVVSPQTPQELAGHPTVSDRVSIPYEDADLEAFARRLIGG